MTLTSDHTADDQQWSGPPHHTRQTISNGPGHTHGRRSVMVRAKPHTADDQQWSGSLTPFTPYPRTHCLMSGTITEQDNQVASVGTNPKRKLLNEARRRTRRRRPVEKTPSLPEPSKASLMTPTTPQSSTDSTDINQNPPERESTQERP